MLLPLGAAFFRAIGYPVTMIGFKELPDPFFAGLVSYSVSLLVALCLFKIQRRVVCKIFMGLWLVCTGRDDKWNFYLLPEYCFEIWTTTDRRAHCCLLTAVHDNNRLAVFET